MHTHSLRDFNPAATARLDTMMWRAYYQHKFGKMVFLLIKLMHTQFGLNWLQSIKAAYYSGRAATAFRKNAPTKEYSKPLADLEVFFEYIHQHAVEDFDSKQVASLELEWWLVHRHPKEYTQTLEDALAAAMAALYNIPAASLQKYALYRAKAMHTRDVATHKLKAEPDWIMIEDLLNKSYAHLSSVVRQ